MEPSSTHANYGIFSSGVQHYARAPKAAPAPWSAEAHFLRGWRDL